MKEFFSWIQSAFESIVDIFESVIQLVLSIGESLFDLIKMIPAVVTMVTSSIGYLPSMLILFAGLSITVSVVYLIAGRNNN